ncbi:hypothetical protein QE152_g38144 [Popillia japonica]|uniref:Uncharacterized protein n=1 Tax=Popillia japonica TaxID=7064 RepID=A0AAW1I7V4_POPJA
MTELESGRPYNQRVSVDQKRIITVTRIGLDWAGSSSVQELCGLNSRIRKYSDTHNKTVKLIKKPAKAVTENFKLV